MERMLGCAGGRWRRCGALMRGAREYFHFRRHGMAARAGNGRSALVVLAQGRLARGESLPGCWRRVRRAQRLLCRSVVRLAGARRNPYMTIHGKRRLRLRMARER